MLVYDISMYTFIQVWFLATICLFTANYNSSSRESDFLFESLRSPGTHIMYMHTCSQNIYTYFLKIFYNVLKIRLFW